MGQGRRAANEGGRGRVGGIASSVGYRVKFSAEYKGPSRAWPKAGFTALLVNLAVCAYNFKTHFDPPGWKGSYCRRQFSVFSLYRIIASWSANQLPAQVVNLNDFTLKSNKDAKSN